MGAGWTADPLNLDVPVGDGAKARRLDAWTVRSVGCCVAETFSHHVPDLVLQPPWCWRNHIHDSRRGLDGLYFPERCLPGRVA